MKFRELKKIKSLSGSLIIPLLCLLFLFVSLGSALALPAEEANTAKLLEGAKKEGKLVWYTTMSTGDCDKLVGRFKEKYPFLDTVIYRAGGEGMMMRILAEVRAQRHLFDVAQSAVLNTEVLKKKGLFAKYLSPESRFYPEGSGRDPEGYWTSIILYINVVGYNTKLVPPPEVPKTYEDLLNRKWKGRIGMDDKAFYWFADVLRIMGEKKGLEYMKKLAEQNIQFRNGKTLITQLVAAGELSIGVPLYNQRIEQMKAQGAPVEWTPLDPNKVIPQINPLAVSAQAPHPNAARLFADFALSREGQGVITSFYGVSSRNDVDPIVPRLKKGLKIMPFDPGYIDNYERYVKLYREILMKR